MNRYRIFFIAMFFHATFGMKAQEVITTDSLSIQQCDKVKVEQNPLPYETKVNQNFMESDFRPEMPSLTGNTTYTINPKAIETQPLKPYLLQWQGGLITGANSAYDSPIAISRSASFIGRQQWGDFNLSGNLSLSKDYMAGMGFMNGAGVGLQLDYRINNNIALSGFGGVQQLGFMGPAPNMRNFYYGGFVTFNTNNGKWGMDVGMRRYYNAATGQWTNMPIVMPYYNLNGTKLGIDVGGLLMNIFQGVDKALNPHHYDPRRNGGIIMPQVTTIKGFGPPPIPYIK